MIDAQEFDSVKSLEVNLDFTPGSKTNPQFIKFALECALARERSARGDNYQILSSIDGALSKTAKNNRNLENLHDLGDRFFHIGLQRKAWKTFRRILSPKKMLLDSTASIVELLMSYYNSGVSQADLEDTSHQGEIKLMLSDMLRVTPNNGWYDDTQFAEFLRDMGDYALAGPNDSTQQFMMSLYANSLARDSQTDDDNFIALNVIPFLPKEDLAKLFHILMDRSLALGGLTLTSIDSGQIEDLLAGLKFGIDTIRSPILYDGYFDDSTIVLSYSCNFDQRLNLFIHRQADRSEATCFMVTDPIERLRFLDMNGDKRKECLIQTRAGSGGFLSACILRLNPMQVIWRTGPHYHGDISVIDFNGDRIPEILVSEAVDSPRISWCNQCPSPYLFSLFKYDPVNQTYAEVANLASTSELLLQSHTNIVGLSPQMMLSVYPTMESDKTDPLQFLRELASEPDEAFADTALLSRTLEKFEWRLQALNDGKAFETESNLIKALLEALNRPGLGRLWNLYKTSLHERLIVALISSNNIERAIAEGKSLESATYATDLGMSFHNIMGVAYLTRNSFGNSFQYLQRAYSELADSDDEDRSVILGNLGWYYSRIHDYASSKRSSLEALDLATHFGEQNDAGIDMMHLAFAEAMEGNDVSALHWLIRSAKNLKGVVNGRGLSDIYQFAASIALKNNLPNDAIRILDQAAALTDEDVWASSGPVLLFLYGRAYSELVNRSYAKEFFESCLRVANQTQHEIAANALYELSRLDYQQKEINASLAEAQECVNAISSTRRKIFLDQQKLLFLTDKEQMVEWCIKLMYDHHESDLTIFNTIEAWKMQSFIDAYGGVLADSVRGSVSELSDLIRSKLSSHDMFVDFFIGKSFSLAVTLEGTGELGVLRLDTDKKSIESLTERVQSAFNLQVPNSLENIRRDVLSADLKDNLKTLYQTMFQKFKVSDNIRRLIISPDGPQFGIPWAALIGQDGSYLIDTYDLVLTPSAMVDVMLWKQRRGYTGNPHTERKALLIGCGRMIEAAELRSELPDAGQLSKLDELPRLRNVVREISYARQAFEKDSVHCLELIDRGSASEVTGVGICTPKTFLENVASSSFVHVATHGLFNGLDPMQSIVFLERDSMYNCVRARDFIDVGLAKTELVFLSSCRSGQSAAMPGAEPVGFVRSLMAAGATRVILSSWDVDDEATLQLIRSFYRPGFERSMSHSLRIAQLETKKLYSHPFYWAGFELYGTWD